MATNASTPVERAKPLIEMMNAFRKSKVLFAAIKLGVFETLKNPASPVELATNLKCDQTALEGLLNACVHYDLLQKKDNIYSLSSTSTEFLLEKSPYPLTGYAMHSNDVLYKLWDHLEDSVRTGSNVWKEAFNVDQKEIFGNIYKDKNALKRFTNAMNSFSRLGGDALVQAFDLSRFKKITDLGGGSGALVIAALQRYKDLQGVVVELPSMTDNTTEYIRKVAATGTVQDLERRISVHGCDFFAEDFPSSDLYVLSKILHDWDLPRIKQLLRKLYQKMSPGGGLLLLEILLDENKCGPEHGVLQNLNMLVQTEGAERTFAEYEALLKEAGFSAVEARKTGQMTDAVLAIK
eukprot:TRINITY_DN8686_c0_g1_i1.p1 TRINITY_DN8686_c0_g1~~TRINITY_DN8686_c0_g1_i1.p1  ORF type:complete len:376 (-),score=87.79 TRINITY_DN8686_c0_g1_i1:80-1129(-)